jgi:pentafunctional AROM polypeptide
LPCPRSFFLSLTFADVAEAAGQMATLTEGAHAVELRVDLLRSVEACAVIMTPL